MVCYAMLCYAKVKLASAQDFVGRIADGVVGTLNAQGQFAPRELTNVAYAFATLKGDPQTIDTVLTAIARAAVPQARVFNPRDVANTVWAFATAGVKAPELFDALTEPAVAQAAHFNGQDLGNTVWAFATAQTGSHLDSSHSGDRESLTDRALWMFDELARCGARAIEAMNGQEIANTMWAFGQAANCQLLTLNTCDLYDAVSRRVLKDTPGRLRFTVQGATMALMGLAQLLQRHDSKREQFMTPARFQLISDAVCHLLRQPLIANGDNLEALDLAGATWALSMTRVRDSNLLGSFDSAATKGLSTLPRFDERHKTMLAAAFAHLAYPADFFGELARMSAEEVAAYSPRQLTSIVWAMACADQRHRQFLELARSRMLEMLHAGELEMIHMHKIHRALTADRTHSPSLPARPR